MKQQAEKKNPLKIKLRKNEVNVFFLCQLIKFHFILEKIYLYFNSNKLLIKNLCVTLNIWIKLWLYSDKRKTDVVGTTSFRLASLTLKP